MKRLRIGFFVWEYPPKIVGGLGNYAQNVCPQLVKLGCDVTLFVRNDGTLKTRETLQGVDVHRPLIVDASGILPPFATGWGSSTIEFFNDAFVFSILSAAKMVNQLIKMDEYEFDIIAAHGISAMAGKIVKQETGLPFVFHIHSTEKWGWSMERVLQFVWGIADRVVTDNDVMQSRMVSYGFDEKEISVCCDPSRLLQLYEEVINTKK